MPNWMECEVRIIGPTDEIARFRTAHIGNDQNGDLRLDFDSIVPMPPERMRIPMRARLTLLSGRWVVSFTPRETYRVGWA